MTKTAFLSLWQVCLPFYRRKSPNLKSAPNLHLKVSKDNLHQHREHQPHLVDREWGCMEHPLADLGWGCMERLQVDLAWVCTGRLWVDLVWGCTVDRWVDLEWECMEVLGWEDLALHQHGQWEVPWEQDR